MHIPEEIANLKNLEELHIKNNCIYDLPDSIGKLSHLKILDAGHNDLTMYSESIGDLVSLEKLDVSNNRLRFIHDDIGKLESLRVLNVRNNKIQYIPESLSGLKNLRMFDLRNNEFFFFPESISKLQKQNVKIQSDIPLTKYSTVYKKKRKLKDYRGVKLPRYEIKFLEDIERLVDKRFLIDSNYLDFEVQNNGIFSLKINGWNKRMYLDIIPESIGNLKRLQELTVMGTDIKTLPDSIGEVQYLASLSLHFNKIQILPDSLENLSRIKEFIIHGNQLERFPNLSSSLKRLWIYSNQIKVLPDSISRLQNLENFFIGNNKLSQLPYTLGKLKNLRSLNLSGNCLTTLPESIGDLSNLEYLNLADNKLSTLPPSIQKLANLKNLVLKGNQIQRIPPELGKLINLENLDTQNNPISLYSESLEYLKPLSQTKITLLNPEFKINDFLSLKLEKGKTNIYVKHKLFQQCKFLMLTIPIGLLESSDEISSIDEAESVLDHSLEGGIYEISPEVEYWGHCSNMQVWYENNYDTRLLHRNLAFPLLKSLTDVGDPLARKMFKEEIARRYSSNHETVKLFLTVEGYLGYLDKEELESIRVPPVIIRKTMQKKEALLTHISIKELNEEYRTKIKNIERNPEFHIKNLHQISYLLEDLTIYFADFSTHTNKFLRFIIFPDNSEYELLLRYKLKTLLKSLRHSSNVPFNFEQNLPKKYRVFTALFDEIYFNYLDS